jgi:hypothetical protein
MLYLSRLRLRLSGVIIRHGLGRGAGAHRLSVR